MTKKYRVTYLSGSGQEYEDGEWEVKTTPKSKLALKVKEYGVGIFKMHSVGEKFKIGHNTGNPVKDENDDGSFTIYFKQAGTPYIFTPLI